MTVQYNIEPDKLLISIICDKDQLDAILASLPDGIVNQVTIKDAPVIDYKDLPRGLSSDG